MRPVEVDDAGCDVLAQSNAEGDSDPFSEIQAASTQNKIAMGPNKGKFVRRLIAQLEEQALTSEPRITGELVATHLGFSLHAAVSCWSTNKARLEQLAGYTARPAVSEERLSIAANGLVHYSLKKPLVGRHNTCSLLALRVPRKTGSPRATAPNPPHPLSRHPGPALQGSKARRAPKERRRSSCQWRN